jgi:hypothetical protein
MIEVQRNLLRAADAYLDARFEVSQAAADLANAVGDPAVGVGASAAPSPEPVALPGPVARPNVWRREIP